jgi:branched-chain amino acid transport system ATP-binding protein
MSGGYLDVSGLTVRFGGLKAVDGVTFSVRSGELFGIVGPNGAGKTTLFNSIAGAVRRTSGEISLSGVRIDGQSPERIARIGIARTFQNVRLFHRMTLLENLIVAANATSPHLRVARRRSTEIIEMLGLASFADRFPGELPLGIQKQAEIGRALALSPTILLLDEMMSGLNDDETTALIRTVRRLNGEGLTVIIIEHVIRVITSLTHRIIVLDHSQVIASGAPDVVMREPSVVEAYLGRKWRTDIDSRPRGVSGE